MATKSISFPTPDGSIKSTSALALPRACNSQTKEWEKKALMVASLETFQKSKQVPAAVPSHLPEELPNSLLLNRELSLLEFHRRVLDEARDETNPLLERLKFLGIFASNINEFFMVRVSALKEELEENVTEL